MGLIRSIDSLKLHGDALCLNFVNTIHDRNETPAHDYLQSYEDLIEWSETSGALPDERSALLIQMAATYPQKSEEHFGRAVEARELLYNLFRHIARNGSCSPKLLDELNGLLPSVFSHIQLGLDSNKPIVTWKRETARLDEPVWRVIKSAYDLLLERPYSRIKECDMCGWLFLDKSKNKSRKWCSMETCGSIHKSTNYYYRKKRERSEN